jgi:hypothetical protein
MFNWKNSDVVSPVFEIEAAVTASKPEPVERQILRDVSAQRDAARQRVDARMAEVDRLNLVIAEGAKVAATLQNDNAADGAAGIAALVAGEAPGAAMASLVAIEMAARAASARLPNAQAALAEAKAALERAEVEAMRAVRNLALTEVSRKVAEHRHLFDELCRLNDELIGASFGLPPTERLGQELHNLVVPIEVPAFNLGGSYAATMRHIVDEAIVAKSTARWTRARESLLDDPDADFVAVLDQPVTLPTSTGSAPVGVIRGINPASLASHDAGQIVEGSQLNVGFRSHEEMTLRVA